MGDPTTIYSFDNIDCNIMSIFDSREGQENLMQWGLDKKERFNFYRFRYFGGIFNETKEDYDNLIRDFLLNKSVMATIGVNGNVLEPMKYNCKELSTKSMTMELFDRLKNSNIVTDSGTIRGCFNETYDGVSVDDLLRDLFVNPDSENYTLYTDDEKNELIYQFMRIFVLGGEMCQPDTDIKRYLENTKNLYKAALTVYRKEDKDDIVVAGKVYEIISCDGLQIFPVEDNARNKLIIMVDPKKNFITICKNAHENSWC